MKYVVMECHTAYAVLMDEDSRFVKAANLNYEVGQTVENPVLMESFKQTKTAKLITIKRIIAAAACLAILTSSGYIYYRMNFKTYSTVLISSESDIRMALNKKGEVLYLESNDLSGKKIIKTYDAKGKDKVTAANDILKKELEDGVISSGDTVELYIKTDDSVNYDAYKSEFEKEIPRLNLNVKVHGMEDYKKPENNTEKEQKEEPSKPVPPHEKENEDKLPEKPEKPEFDENTANPPTPPKPVKPDENVELPQPPKVESPITEKPIEDIHKKPELKNDNIQIPTPPKVTDKKYEAEKPHTQLHQKNPTLP